MNVSTLDLIGDYAADIGSSFSITVQLCNAPDLTQYTGSCHVRQNNTSPDIIVSPTVTIVDKSTFDLSIPFAAWTANIVAGSYVYDVLFSKSDKRFYAIAGKIQLVKRVTVI